MADPGSDLAQPPRLLEVGRVAKAHGVRGEVIVQLLTDRTERLEPGSVLYTETGALEVVRSSRHQARWIVAFAGVGDRSGAEALHGVVLKAPPLDDPATLWIHELIGAKVVDVGGQALGTVAAVEANPASDLLVLDNGGLIPLRFVVQHSADRIVVEVPPGLLD